MKPVLPMILLALAAGPSPAAALPPAVDLRTVLQFARDASIPVAVERTGVDAARAERVSATALPNPTMGYVRHRQPGRLTNFDSDRANDWSLEQPLLLGGQRGARDKAASHAVETASARVALAQHALASQAAAAYVGLLLAQKRVTLLREGLEDLERLRGVVAGRRASGLASEYELARVEVEEASWRARVADAEATQVEEQAALASTLGVPDWHPVALDVVQAPGAFGDGGVAAHPEVLLAQSEADLARAQVDLARSERMPAVSVNVNRFWTSQPHGATTSIGFAVELPLFDRRQGGLDKAKAEAASALLQRELAQARASTEVASQARLVEGRRRALDAFERSAGARLPALRRMAEDAYRFGRTPVSELLDATRSGTELAIARAELMAGLMDAQLKLEAARGILLRRAE